MVFSNKYNNYFHIVLNSISIFSIERWFLKSHFLHSNPAIQNFIAKLHDNRIPGYTLKRINTIYRGPYIKYEIFVVLSAFNFNEQKFRQTFNLPSEVEIESDLRPFIINYKLPHESPLN